MPPLRIILRFIGNILSDVGNFLIVRFGPNFQFLEYCLPIWESETKIAGHAGMVANRRNRLKSTVYPFLYNEYYAIFGAQS